MLISFNVKDQKITHDLGERILVSESAGVIKAEFTFDREWDRLDKVVVFSNSNKKCTKPLPVRYEEEPIDIPVAVLKAGKLYVSVVGFGEDEKRLTTRKWDIQQAITIQECGAMGDCELLRNMVCNSDTVSNSDIATDREVKDMLNEVFGGDENMI